MVGDFADELSRILGTQLPEDDRGIVGAVEDWLSTDEAESYLAETVGAEKRQHNPEQDTSL